MRKHYYCYDCSHCKSDTPDLQGYARYMCQSREKSQDLLNKGDYGALMNLQGIRPSEIADNCTYFSYVEGKINTTVLKRLES